MVIYGVDPRGLPTFQLTAADNTDGMSAQKRARVPSNRSSAYLNSQTGTEYLARQTGGLFLQGNNNLDAAVDNVSTDASGYYLLGYQPDSHTFSAANRTPVYHKLEVRLKRKDLHVRSRGGFFNTPTVPKDLSRVSLRLQTRQGQIDNAFDSPFSLEGIQVRLSALFTQSAKEESWIDGLLYIDAKELRFSEEPDGTHHAEIEVVSMLSSADIPKPEFRLDTVTMRFGPAIYRSALENGITWTLHRRVAKPGAYQLKVVVRDSHSEEIGSASQFLDVPDLSKGRWPFLELC